MAAPVLTIVSIAALFPTPRTIDVTALTGGANGDTGADWNIDWPGLRYKTDGGYQCEMQLFGAADSQNNFYWGDGNYVVGSDSVEPTSPNQQSRSHSWNSDINCGAFTTSRCDQKLRKLRWYGALTGGGWQFTATPSDGSSAPVSFTPPNNGTPFGLLCTYRGVQADATLDFRLTKTGSASGYFGRQLQYIEVPVAPPRPRGIRIGAFL